MFPPSHPAFSAVATDRVRLTMERGDLDAAARQADDAVALMEREPRFQSSLPVALRMRARVHLRGGKFAEARADAERLVPLVLAETPEGALSATVGVAYLTLGEALAGEGRTAEAKTVLTDAIRHLDDAAGAAHPDAKRARALLARLS
jgi:hypothetical protein